MPVNHTFPYGNFDSHSLRYERFEAQPRRRILHPERIVGHTEVGLGERPERQPLGNANVLSSGSDYHAGVGQVELNR